MDFVGNTWLATRDEFFGLFAHSNLKGLISRFDSWQCATDTTSVSKYAAIIATNWLPPESAPFCLLNEQVLSASY